MFTISGFYKFKKINSLKKYKIYLEKEISNTSIRGSIIISSEGINGSLAGKNKDLYQTMEMGQKVEQTNKHINKHTDLCKF